MLSADRNGNQNRHQMIMVFMQNRHLLTSCHIVVLDHTIEVQVYNQAAFRLNNDDILENSNNL